MADATQKFEGALGITKEAFQRLEKVLKDRKLTMETKIRALAMYYCSYYIAKSAGQSHHH